MKEGIVPKGKIITLACIGFVAGTGVFSFIKPPGSFECLVISVAAAGLLTVARIKRVRLAQIITALIIGFGFGGWRYGLVIENIPSDAIRSYNGTEVRFIGIVIKEPQYGPERQRLVVRATKANGKAASGNVQLSLFPYPRYRYGDELDISCLLETPENREFAYDRYLARYGIYSLCNRPKIRLISSEKGNAAMAFLLRVKSAAFEIAKRYLPSPESDLALPIVFGGDGGLDDATTESFRRVGLTHIMAVSGFNVSLLAVIIGAGLSLAGLKRPVAFILSSLIISAYVAMVGAPASAVRAGILSILLLFSLVVGRAADISRTILIVGVGTLLVNPRMLRDDIGWQLSFLAIYGLVYIHPLVQKGMLYLTRGKAKFVLDMLGATIAAQIATTPVTLYRFGQVSLIAPLANMLVVWIIPVLTIAVIIAIILTAIFPSLGLMFFFPAWVMIKYIFFVVERLALLSWSVITTGD